MAVDAREAARQSYRPERVRLLFIGESPPNNGTFFYYANSILFRETRQAFENALAGVGAVPDGGDLLRCFQRSGCCLEDLCLEPVNHLPRAQRRARREEGVDGLTGRIRAILGQGGNERPPAAVVVVMRAITPYVDRALGQAGVHAPTHSLPFPAQGRQVEYRRRLAALLEDLWARRVVNSRFVDA